MKKAVNLVRLMIGAALMAAAVNCIFAPMQMVVGGVTGLGITANRVLSQIEFREFPIWVYNLVLNVPLLIWAWRSKGLSFVGKTLVGVGFHTLFLWLIPEKAILDEDYLLSAIVGGAVGGLGVGYVFRAGGSTGGSDLLSALLAKRRPNAAPEILMWIDGAIVAIGCIVFGINRALYAVLAVFVITQVSDRVLEGFCFAKTVFIVTDKPEKISQAVLSQVQRGVSAWKVQGMYTGTEKTLLMCVVAKRELGKLQEVITDNDSEAFVMIQNSSKAMGKGFIQIDQ